MLSFADLKQKEEFYRTITVFLSKAVFSPAKIKTQSYDSTPLIEYLTKPAKFFESIYQELFSEKFNFSPLLQRKRVLNGKSRELFIAPWKDRLVDLYLYHQLDSRFNSLFSTNSYAFRTTTKGAHACIKIIRENLPKGSFYVVRRDVKSYYPSINKEILFEKLKTCFADDYLLELLRQRIYYEYTPSRVSEVDAEQLEIKTDSVGIPFGTPIACWFANFYLTDLDKALEKIPNVFCVRYADDYCLFSSDLEQIRKAEQILDEGFRSLKLEHKETHRQNLAINNSASFDFVEAKSFTFLGFVFQDQKVLIGKNKKEKLRERIKQRVDKKLKAKKYKKASYLERARLASEAIQAIFEGKTIADQIAFEYVFANITDEVQLKQLDQWTYEYIMHAVLGYKAWRRGNLKHVSLQQLRKFGLPSFVHAKRTSSHRIKGLDWLKLSKY